MEIPFWRPGCFCHFVAPRSVTVDHYAVAHDAPVAGRSSRHGAARQPHVLRVVPGQDHGVGKHEDCPAEGLFPGRFPALEDTSLNFFYGIFFREGRFQAKTAGDFF